MNEQYEPQNFEESLRLAVRTLAANLKADQRLVQRWTRALERAATEFETNDLMSWDGRELQICSSRSGKLYRARTDYCECRGYQEGFPCYHRAIVKILREINY